MEQFKRTSSNTIIVSNKSKATTSSVNFLSNNTPEPLWLEGEKILNQKFFVHNRYVSAFYSNVARKPRKKIPRGKHKNREKKEVLQTNIFYNRNFPSANNEDFHSLDISSSSSASSRSEEDQEVSPSKVNSLPSPGKAATSLLNLFDHFASGLEELFPNFVLSDKLKPHVSECDSIHIMSKMHSVASRMQTIVNKQVSEYVNEDDNPEKKVCTKRLIEDIKEAFVSKITSRNGISNTKFKKLDHNKRKR